MRHTTRLARCAHYTTQSINSNNAAAATGAAAAPGCDPPVRSPPHPQRHCCPSVRTASCCCTRGRPPCRGVRSQSLQTNAAAAPLAMAPPPAAASRPQPPTPAASLLPANAYSHLLLHSRPTVSCRGVYHANQSLIQLPHVRLFLPPQSARLALARSCHCLHSTELERGPTVGLCRLKSLYIYKAAAAAMPVTG